MLAGCWPARVTGRTRCASIIAWSAGSIGVTAAESLVGMDGIYTLADGLVVTCTGGADDMGVSGAELHRVMLDWDMPLRAAFIGPSWRDMQLVSVR